MKKHHLEYWDCDYDGNAIAKTTCGIQTRVKKSVKIHGRWNGVDCKTCLKKRKP